MNRILPKKVRLVPKTAIKVFSGEIFDIYQWQQKMYDNSFQTFEMAKRADTVQIIGIIEGEVVVLNEEQPDGTVRTYSLPGGRVDIDDKSLLTAAKREMLEETGLKFKGWKLLNVYQPESKIEWFVYVFIAWDLSHQSSSSIDVGEKIVVQQMSWEKYLQKGRQQTILLNNLSSFLTVSDLIKAQEYSDHI